MSTEDHSPKFEERACPIPISDYPTIQLAHGGGGRLMHRLIEDLFLDGFQGRDRVAAHDGAALQIGGASLAFTTDSYVVKPLFFAGGNIGDLAVNGTLNDLAMCGARPLYLSSGFILEEGFETTALHRIVESMRKAADIGGVRLVTGDTKVVDRGSCDGVYINTAGIGQRLSPTPIGPATVRPGDAIILSGDLGRHGTAIMAQRESLAFESEITTDCAPLWPVVDALLATGCPLHCMRDLTRGGLASALVEIAEGSALHLHVRSADIPVREDVRGACELLGLDPMYVANEGRMIAIVPEANATRAVEAMRTTEAAADARVIGCVDDERRGMVTLESEIGAVRIVDMLSGEQLPRIC